MNPSRPMTSSVRRLPFSRNMDVPLARNLAEALVERHAPNLLQRSPPLGRWSDTLPWRSHWYGAMTTLYRSMKNGGDGLPLCGPSARALGVRHEGDLPIGEDGTVSPGTGGMSVALGDPMRLPTHRRPTRFEGWGQDPVWEINNEELPDSLVLRRDPKHPTDHGFVEPVRTMQLRDYQEALTASRGSWRRT